MPGIFGLVTRIPRPDAEAELLRMLAEMRHDPSSCTGIWINEPAGIYVGWCERQNATATGLPLTNEHKDLTLLFSGEDFPEPGVACRLKQRGHVLEDGPLSYLVHLAEEEPAAFLRALNGRFHGLLVNDCQQTAMLFNDRYGLHRLYYAEKEDSFYFAAEAKAILAACPELRKADPRGLGEYLACGCVLENRTLFAGIKLLPPASAWTFRARKLQKRGAYFQPREWEEQEPLHAESYYQELKAAFAGNLPRYFMGGTPVAVSLTGGLDTRAIMAWNKAAPQSVPCYTFGGMYRECRDVKLARRVAQLCHQPHSVIEVGQEFLSHFAHYAEQAINLTDGCCSVSQAADLYVNERAAQIAPVRMTGNYGDEVLSRRRVFRPEMPADGVFSGDLLPHLHAAHHTYAAVIGGNTLSFTAFRQAPWHHYGLLALEQTQLTLRSPYLDNDVVRTAFRAPASVLANRDLRARLIYDGNPELAAFRTDLGFGGNTEGLAAAAAQHFHLSTMRAEYVYDYGMPQWLAHVDYALSALHLERLFLGRHKFCHYRIWYRGVLREYVQGVLLDPGMLALPYINRPKIEAAVAGHLRGNQNFTSTIHQLLSLELIHRLFLGRH